MIPPLLPVDIYVESPLPQILLQYQRIHVTIFDKFVSALPKECSESLSHGFPFVTRSFIGSLRCGGRRVVSPPSEGCSQFSVRLPLYFGWWTLSVG
jgi:hypothetical protein